MRGAVGYTWARTAAEGRAGWGKKRKSNRGRARICQHSTRDILNASNMSVEAPVGQAATVGGDELSFSGGVTDAV